MRKTIILIIFIVFAISLLPFVTNASALGGSFGGKLIDFRPCLTPPGWIIDVGGVSGGEFFFQPGISRLFMYYDIFSPGVNVLGTSLGFLACVLPPGLGGGPIIQMIGTSSTP